MRYGADDSIVLHITVQPLFYTFMAVTEHWGEYWTKMPLSGRLGSGARSRGLHSLL